MITCLICKRTISSCLDTNTALPQWTRNHVHHCRSCAEACESATALARQLAASAAQQKQSPSPFLHGKIMSAVRSSQHSEAQFGAGGLFWATALGAICLLAAGIVWWRQAPAENLGAGQPSSAPTELALNVKLPSAAQVEQWTKSLDAPLEQETKLVLRDASVAFNTLVRGFVPEDLLAPSTEPAQR